MAGDFTRYDEHAVRQINRSIELVRYRDFSGELLALELMTAVTGTSEAGDGNVPAAAKSISPSTSKTVSQLLEKAPVDLKDLYAELETFLTGLGDDVQKKVLKQ